MPRRFCAIECEKKYLGMSDTLKKKKTKKINNKNEYQLNENIEIERASAKTGQNTDWNTYTQWNICRCWVWMFLVLFGLFGVSICFFTSFQFLSFFFFLSSVIVDEHRQHHTMQHTHIHTHRRPIHSPQWSLRRVNRKWINVYRVLYKQIEREREPTHTRSRTYTNTYKVKNGHRNKRPW